MSAAFYGSGDPSADEQQQLEAIDKLVELCAPSPAFLDTAFVYSHPTGLHSEQIVGKAIAKHGRDKFIIATKFGSGQPTPNSSTETIHSQYAASVARLGSPPDLYYQHRPDPARPIEAVMADLKAMHGEGKFKYVGLSECTPDELRRAHAVFPVSAIQMEWSVAERSIEAALVPVCAELGVAIVAYSPLARGLLSGTVKAELDATDRRRLQPRWAPGALERNSTKLGTSLGELAAKKGCTPAQLALAWLLSKGDNVFPIPGSKTSARVAENMGATSITLTPDEIAEIEAVDLKPEGNRYPPQMAALCFEARMQG